MKLYHGTTADNASLIYWNGYNPKKQTWRISDHAHMFFYRADAKDAFTRAAENANISAVIQDYKGTGLAVMEFEVPDDLCIFYDHTVTLTGEGVVLVRGDHIERHMVRGIYINEQIYNPILRYVHLCFHLCENGCINLDLSQSDWNGIFKLRDFVNYRKFYNQVRVQMTTPEFWKDSLATTDPQDKKENDHE